MSSASERLQAVMRRWLTTPTYPHVLLDLRSDLIPRLEDTVPYRTGMLRSWSDPTQPVVAAPPRTSVYTTTTYAVPDVRVEQDDDVAVAALADRLAQAMGVELRVEEDIVLSKPTLTAAVLDELAKPIPPEPEVVLYVDDDPERTPLAARTRDGIWYVSPWGEDSPKVPAWIKEEVRVRRERRQP